MKKKKVWSVLTGIALALIVVVVLQLAGIIPFPSFLKKHDNSDSDSVKILNDYQIKLYVFGDKIKFPGELDVNYLTQIDSSALLAGENPAKTVLIINDLSGSIRLSPEEISVVNSLIYDKHLNVMYFGDKYLSEWDDDSQTIKVQLEGEKAVSYFSFSDKALRGTGFWTTQEDEISKENSDLLGSIITYQIEEYIRKAF